MGQGGRPASSQFRQESARTSPPADGAASGLHPHRGDSVTPKIVWFITGAGRGMGADFARAVLAAGHQLVATGRDTDRLTGLLEPSDDLLAVKLDVTRRSDAEAAVQAAVDRFARIDVLVNNAANFYAGFFEELT